MSISDKQKQILALLVDGQFHSGTELSDILGVSRSAIWKHMQFLASVGLPYSAVSGKGYRLERPLELLAPHKIGLTLNNQAKSLISSLEIHQKIDSTNRYLSEQAQNHAPSGSICLAEYQTAGKGRRGRQWVSPFGSNIYLSILWRFQQGPASISGLSLAIGVAVIRALKIYGIDELGLKWPNDIYSQGKKFGGILVEVSGESGGPCVAVIGLGLNMFLPEAEAEGISQAWTDLNKITGRNDLARNELAGLLLNELLPVVAEFETLGIKAYLDEWRDYDCLRQKSATLFIANQPFTGIVQGIDDSGMLLIKRPDGSIQTFASGEVSFNDSSL
ncbi:MAG: bifunctional biotin--[acetyl-CoA-carboxylase] ligase/biotin operon repressor BirA [Methylococcales bacterium]|nr:bifunctional biotin--[acetyl-CoA-carboxylase] ligase/biotin operon repressor BirA [Methylococcales bacterium]